MGGTGSRVTSSPYRVPDQLGHSSRLRRRSDQDDRTGHVSAPTGYVRSMAANGNALAVRGSLLVGIAGIAIGFPSVVGFIHGLVLLMTANEGLSEIGGVIIMSSSAVGIVVSVFPVVGMAGVLRRRDWGPVLSVIGGALAAVFGLLSLVISRDLSAGAIALLAAFGCGLLLSGRKSAAPGA